jgi:hypothetical protein
MTAFTENDLKRLEDLIINGQKAIETRLTSLENGQKAIRNSFNLFGEWTKSDSKLV